MTFVKMCFGAFSRRDYQQVHTNSAGPGVLGRDTSKIVEGLLARVCFPSRNHATGWLTFRVHSRVSLHSNYALNQPLLGATCMKFDAQVGRNMQTSSESFATKVRRNQPLKKPIGSTRKTSRKADSGVIESRLRERGPYPEKVRTEALLGASVPCPQKTRESDPDQTSGGRSRGVASLARRTATSSELGSHHSIRSWVRMVPATTILQFRPERLSRGLKTFFAIRFSR